ncbi:MAG: protein kinase [Planctomycetes bacterium]|nr:protein kinase [Planctomycetota bacterium]
MPRLIVEKGPDKGKSIRISGNDTIVIGRETTANLRLSDIMASRMHFRIEFRADGGYYLIDLNSMNGTFVNGQKVKERALKLGDKVQIGETLFTFMGDIEAQKQGPIGQTIGGYTIMERVGRGGMGTVYKALQISLNRVVALKLLSDELVKDKTFINLFVQEARAAAQLNHPNIVQVYDVGSDKEVYFFSMEYVPGASLQDILSKRKKLPPEVAVGIVFQAAQGLEYAEKKGIVHRDIKPDNLMMGENEIIKIGDLGLAKSLKAPFAEEQASSVFGTPHYVAPEQATGKPVDHRADIYSLGSTFYRILTGITPYSGSSVKEIIAKKIKDDPTPIKQLEPGLSSELSKIIDKMIKRNPDERFQTFSEVLKALETIKSGVISTRATSTPDDTSKKEPSKEEGTLPKNLIDSIVLPVILTVLSGLSLFLIVWHHYKNIGPGFEPTVIPQNGFQPDEKQIIAEIDKLDTALKDTPQDDVELLMELITRYEKLTEKCRNIKLSIVVQVKLADLDKRFNQISEPVRQKYKEKKSSELFTALTEETSHERQQIITLAKTGDVDFYIKKWIEGWENFKLKYAGTASVAHADEQIRQANLFKGRIENSREHYEKLQPQVKNAVKEHRFKEAYDITTGFINDEKYQDTLYNIVASELLLEIKNRGLDDFQETRNEAVKLMAEEKLEEAKKLLEKKQGFYGEPELEQMVRDNLADIEQKIQQQKNTAFQKLLGIDEGIFYRTYPDVLMLVHESDLSNPDKLLKEAESLLNIITVKTPDYNERKKDILYELTCEIRIMNQLKLNAAQFKGKKSLRNQKISDISNSGIVLQNGELVLWRKISSPELFDLISKGWKLSSSETLKLAILCLKRGGMINEAKTLLNTALKNNQDKEETAVINKYLGKLEESVPMREKDADFIFRQANAQFNDQNYFSALKSYNLIKYRFVDTKLYRQAENFIDKKIIEIEERLK